MKSKIMESTEVEHSQESRHVEALRCVICKKYVKCSFLALGQYCLCTRCAMRLARKIVKLLFRRLGKRPAKADILHDADIYVTASSLDDLVKTVKNFGRPVSYGDIYCDGGQVYARIYVITPECKVLLLVVALREVVASLLRKCKI